MLGKVTGHHAGTTAGEPYTSFCGFKTAVQKDSVALAEGQAALILYV